MDDLISRQEVIDLMYEVFKKYSVATDKQDELCGFGTEMFRRIKELPIAFDKEKVVAELEEEKDIAYADFEKYAYDYFLDLDEDVDDWYYKGLERAINVIRKGGVE